MRCIVRRRTAVHCVALYYAELLCVVLYSLVRNFDNGCDYFPAGGQTNDFQMFKLDSG